jgi:hypothetical protein
MLYPPTVRADFYISRRRVPSTSVIVFTAASTISATTVMLAVVSPACARASQVIGRLLAPRSRHLAAFAESGL